MKGHQIRFSPDFLAIPTCFTTTYNVKGKVLTPCRSLYYCHWQFKAFLAVPNPLGGQLVQGVA